ncbi:MAG: HD domain-containing protein [Candidatus Shapirobacteria bacterium]|nr:HD domain-containing protein [Candidatus Shapirobacteria bacterium]MDD3002993.1 HD domain-containing protein [Candidatus Shapirobacteria bacterium]MDD4383139.1 HD domain-containing protein [Candidatus Shapirobacteria bacterium]
MNDFVIPVKVEKLIKKFRENNAEIYIVGGAVRDLILKRQVKDWDFTTNLTPEEMQKIFPKNSFYNNKFGTISVVDGDDIFEVTTFRTERGYSDARHPDEIKWGKTLEEDLQRRDFTINAIALDWNKKLIDLYDGQNDLQSRLVRCVGNPDERFGEDALRMMRAIRIASQIGFLIEEKTFKSIQKNAGLIQKIASERIRDELFKILVSFNPSDGIILLNNSGILKEIIPELLDGVGVRQKGHHIDDVWTHNLKTLDNCSTNNPVTKLAALLHDVGKPKSMIGEGEGRTFHNHEIIGSRMAVNIGKRLRLSNKELEQLFKLVRWHMFSVISTQTDKAVRRFIRNVTIDYIDEMIALRRGDRLGSGAKESSWRWELFKKRIVEVQKQPFSIKDLKINGMDVMEILKIKPSRKVGEVLETIFNEVEEKPELNEREVLLEKVKNLK